MNRGLALVSRLLWKLNQSCLEKPQPSPGAEAVFDSIKWRLPFIETASKPISEISSAI